MERPLPFLFLLILEGRTTGELQGLLSIVKNPLTVMLIGESLSRKDPVLL